MSRRRRIVHLLDVLLADLYPAIPDPPSDYGLTPDELRREANRLLCEGWQRDEVLQRLAVSR